jgi:hypothetical protein
MSGQPCGMEKLIGIVLQQWPFIRLFEVAYSYTELFGQTGCCIRMRLAH